MTHYITFLKAGRFTNMNEKAFLTTRARQAARVTAHTHTIFHRNRYSSFWKIPADIFRAGFSWEAQSGIYRTNLTWGDLEPYLIEIDHGE